jgi:uncharacterized protein
MENSHKIIGRVLSVDNFRVFIKIDEDLHGSYKSGFSDIYEVARINSYLIIPVGADRVVALITRVTMKEEVEFDKNITSITLPTSSRYVSATMLGTITKENDKEKFIQGVYDFPSLDNPVWYVTEKDLDQIFDTKQDKENINYETDFYLPIGTSPAFSNYKVKICPDQFFVKHAAILGNTGSGKSCTLTSIIRNLFRYNYNDNKKLQNAHIIIFDTNGEYKSAFVLENGEELFSKDREELKLINAYYYGGEDRVKIPYWYMNWDEIKSFAKPNEGAQAPVLNRAIGLAKNETESLEQSVLPRYLETDIEQLIESTSEELKKRTWDAGGTWKWKPENEVQKIGETVKKIDNDLGDAIIKLSDKENFNNAEAQAPLREKISELLLRISERSIQKQITSEKNIDLPTWFDYRDLCTKFIDEAINLEGKNNNKIQEYLSTLKLRMNSFLNDKRMAVPLMLKNKQKISDDVLPEFVAFILGDFNRYFTRPEGAQENFIDEYNTDNKPKDIQRSSQLTIIDVSQLPSEVLETITALLGRLILEFVSYFLPENRGKYPIVIVLEEAQNYIAEYKDSVSKKVFERIAREGRKYGISLIVSSQRPSELSKTVLSQCNSFIIHRLQNPDDQKYIRGIISSANADLLEQLPVIPQQHAIITGDCVRTPVQVRIDTVYPTPNSHNPKYIENWLDEKSEIPYKATCCRWLNKSQENGNPKEPTNAD